MDTAVKFLIVVIVAYVGYALWERHVARADAAALAAITDAHGFIQLDPPDGGKRNEVMIIAAQNCPHEAAQHADWLAREMGERKFKFVRTSSVAFTPPPNFDDGFIKRHNLVMNQEPPLVFVNGRVKSNPDIDDVVAEYEEANR